MDAEIDDRCVTAHDEAWWRMQTAKLRAGEIEFWYGPGAGEKWLKQHHPDLYAAGARPFFLG